jgi:hypothetical protein
MPDESFEASKYWTERTTERLDRMIAEVAGAS